MRAPVASLSKKFISTFFAVTLVLGLVPATAFATNDATVDAGEAAGDIAPVEGGDDSSVSEPTMDSTVDSDTTSSDGMESGAPIMSMLASALSSDASILSTDVKLDSDEVFVGSFTVDGLTFSANDDGVALAAVSPDARLNDEMDGELDGEGTMAASGSDSAEKELVIPNSVTYDGVAYDVTAIGAYALYLSGVTEIVLPATVTSIDDRAFRYSDVTAIDAVADNPEFVSLDGVLYSADLSSLLLIPEGRPGTVRIAPSATNVDPEVFSHCPLVTEIVVDADSAALSSADGCLYDASGATLLRVPAGATNITIQEGCIAIEEGALEGCMKLESIDAPGTVESISPYAFSGRAYVQSVMPASTMVEEEPSEAERVSGLVALTSVTGEGPAAEASDITVYVPAGSNVEAWQNAGFEVMYTAPFGQDAADAVLPNEDDSSLSDALLDDEVSDDFVNEEMALESELDDGVELDMATRYGAEAMKTINGATGPIVVYGRNAKGEPVSDTVLNGTFEGIVSWPASAGTALPRSGAYGTGSATTPVTITVIRLKDSAHNWENAVYENAGKELTGFRVRSESGSGSFSISTLESGKKFSFTLFASYLANRCYANDDGTTRIESTNNPLLPVYVNTFAVTDTTPTRTIQVWSRDVNGNTTSESPLYGTFTGRITWPIEAGNDIPAYGRYGEAGPEAEVNIEIHTLQPFAQRYWENSVYQKEGYRVTGFRVREGCGEGFISVEDLERGTGFSFMLFALSLNPSISTLSSAKASIGSINNPLEPVHARTTADGTIQAWGYSAAGVPNSNSILDGTFSGTVSWPSAYGDTLPAGSAANKAQANVTVDVSSYTSAYTKWNSQDFRKDGYTLTGFRVREGCGEGTIPLGSLQNSEPFTVTFKASTLQTASYYDATTGKAAILTQSYPLEPILEKKSEVNFGSLQVASKNASYANGGSPLTGEFYGSVSWPNGVAGDEMPTSGETPVTVNVTSYTSSLKTQPWEDAQYLKAGYALTGFEVREGCGTGFVSIGTLQQGGPFSFTLYGLSLKDTSYLTDEGVAHIESKNWPLEPVFENGASKASGGITIWSRSFSGAGVSNPAIIMARSSVMSRGRILLAQKCRVLVNTGRETQLRQLLSMFSRSLPLRVDGKMKHTLRKMTRAFLKVSACATVVEAGSLRLKRWKRAFPSRLRLMRCICKALPM